MIKRRTFITTLALGAAAKAADIRPAGGAINRARIRYEADFDADAQTYFTAVTTNGGTMSAATKAAVNAFVLSAKANGYWTKLTRINLFCGDQLAAALVPLKVGGGSATDTNVNFVGGDYSEVTGLTGNGTTKYLNTGLLANALTANDTHIAAYNRSSTGGHTMGVISPSFFHLYAPLAADGKVYSDQYSDTTGRLVTTLAIGTPFGFLVGSRTASNSHVIYRNGASVDSNATVSGSLPAVAIFVFATNNGIGSPAALSADAIGAYSVGAGLTAGNAASFNTDLQTFQTALGRAV